MAKNYENHTRFVYTNRDSIQDAINEHKIDKFDLVICEDTHEFILISDDYSIVPIHSRIYRFQDIASAEEFLNQSPDTYEGQIVAILCNGKYTGYITNKTSGVYEVTPLNQISGEIDYNALSHRPIDNLQGGLDNPITVNTLSDGIYKIKGQYKLSDSDETTYLSPNSNLFLVQHDNTTTYIKKISAADISDYIINDAGEVSVSTVPTVEYLKEQGYATEDYVDKKIEALDIITQQNLEEYVQNVVMEIIENTIDEKLSLMFESATEKEIADLFVS